MSGPEPNAEGGAFKRVSEGSALAAADSADARAAERGGLSRGAADLAAGRPAFFAFGFARPPRALGLALPAPDSASALTALSFASAVPAMGVNVALAPTPAFALPVSG